LLSKKLSSRNLRSKYPGSRLCYSDHIRNDVKCYAKTFYPAWFTPFLVCSENPEAGIWNSGMTNKIGRVILVAKIM